MLVYGYTQHSVDSLGRRNLIKPFFISNSYVENYITPAEYYIIVKLLYPSWPSCVARTTHRNKFLSYNAFVGETEFFWRLSKIDISYMMIYFIRKLCILPSILYNTII